MLFNFDKVYDVPAPFWGLEWSEKEYGAACVDTVIRCQIRRYQKPTRVKKSKRQAGFFYVELKEDGTEKDGEQYFLSTGMIILL